MKDHRSRACLNLTTQSALVAAALMAGCASAVVTEDALSERTAAALNLPAGSVKVSNRADQGFNTSYLATTSSGQQYSCHVTGSVGITGRVVSDALCSPIDKSAGGTKAPILKPAAPAAPPAPTAAAPSAPTTTGCNALLRAAGRCQ